MKAHYKNKVKAGRLPRPYRTIVQFEALGSTHNKQAFRRILPFS